MKNIVISGKSDLIKRSIFRFFDFSTSPTFHLLFLLLLTLPAFAQPVRFSRAVALSSHVGDLCWNSVPSVDTFYLYRHFPDQSAFTFIAAVPDTHYVDTLHRLLCNDTVNYYLEALAPDTLLRSDTTGINYSDTDPTAPCSLRVATISDSLILLTWYPSPDTDILGYYICMGNPCLDFDTVWGRENTRYLCSDTLDPAHEYSFRILAFDSCFNSSPLTTYYHNPILKVTTGGCSRHLHCQWNRYINMPDSVAHYRLTYRFLGSDTLHHFTVGPSGPFEFDTLVPDLSITGVEVTLSVISTNDTLLAQALPCTALFTTGDTAAYVRLTHVEYDESIPSMTLSIEIDPDYGGTRYNVYRSIDHHPFLPIASEQRPLPPSQYLSFTDTDIRRSVQRYRYFVGAFDTCNIADKYSDTLQVLMPPVDNITAFIPNAIIFGDPDRGLFLPRFLAAMAVDYRMVIYNRRGEQIFATTSLTQGWDGTRDGQPLPQGAYVYRIQCHHADNSIKIYTGTILLIK